MMFRSKIALCVFLTLVVFDISHGQFLEPEIEDDDDDEVIIESSVPVESIPYETPKYRKEGVYFQEHFDNPQDFKRRWIPSQSKKPDAEEDIAQYDGKWELHQLDRFPLKDDQGLVLMSAAHHSAIAARFSKPFRFDKKKPFILQYVVAFQNQHDCGGGYMKLLTEGSLKDLKDFNDKTPYTIMFGPDKCGNSAKMHFIVRHKNPVNGTIMEKHCTKLKSDDALYTSREPYLLRLVIKPDNTYQFYINNNLEQEGSLLSSDSFEPPIIPPKEVVDKTDKKPDDWDDRPMIPDPDAKKPEDWDEDEPEKIEDETAEMPEGWLEDEEPLIPNENTQKPHDWDEEMDGIWEPEKVDNPRCIEAPGCGPWKRPLIPNPNYKGKWKPPMIDNPNYKGKWTPRMIPNPDYFFDEAPLNSSPIDAIGFELWSMVNKIYFDDILITDDEDYAEEWTEKTWVLKKKNMDRESTTWYKSFLVFTDRYPWLWGVYVAILAIVIGSIAVYFFRKPGKEDFDRAARHKKTDEDEDANIPPAPEDEQVNREQEEHELQPEQDEHDKEDEEEGVQGDAEQTMLEDEGHVSGDDDVSASGEEEEEELDGDQNVGGTEEEMKKYCAGSSIENNIIDEPDESASEPVPASSSRKRKPRKD